MYPISLSAKSLTFIHCYFNAIYNNLGKWRFNWWERHWENKSAIPHRELFNFPLLSFLIMCCDWAESVGKSGALIMRYSQKKVCISFFFSFVLRILQLLTNKLWGTTGPIQEAVSAKYTSQNEHFNQIENWKCHMLNFRLISLRSNHTLWSYWDILLIISKLAIYIPFNQDWKISKFFRDSEKVKLQKYENFIMNIVAEYHSQFSFLLLICHLKFPS